MQKLEKGIHVIREKLKKMIDSLLHTNLIIFQKITRNETYSKISYTSKIKRNAQETGKYVRVCSCLLSVTLLLALQVGVGAEEEVDLSAVEETTFRAQIGLHTKSTETSAGTGSTSEEEAV